MSERRHRTGPVAAARLVAKIVDPVFRRQGFAEAEVLTRWPEIVGKDLARLATPEKLAFRRGSPAGATLHVRASGPAAVELQHMAPTVIERINTYYGYRAVERLHILQGPALTARTRLSPETPVLPPDIRARIDRAVAGTRHDGLRTALNRLGQSVMARDRMRER